MCCAEHMYVNVPQLQIHIVADVRVLLRRLQLHHANLEASETQKFRRTVYMYNFAAHHHAIHNIAMNEVELLTAMLNDGRRDRKNNEK